MSQLYPYPPYEYSTTCSHLPIVFSFVLVSDSAGDNVLEEDVAKEVALIYDLIWASATRFNGLKGASSLSSIGTWLKFIKVKTTLIYYLGND